MLTRPAAASLTKYSNREATPVIADLIREQTNLGANGWGFGTEESPKCWMFS